jgi:hypothetical protein
MRHVLIPFLAALVALAALHGTAWAIDAAYARQLERSGCTQISETQGCDIRKSRAENAKTGFAAAPPAKATEPKTPYAGHWVARSDAGTTIATIRIDEKERVWVNGSRVPARRSDGGLIFHQGKLHYRIEGDRRLRGEDRWEDRDAGTHGLIHTP